MVVRRNASTRCKGLVKVLLKAKVSAQQISSKIDAIVNENYKCNQGAVVVNLYTSLLRSKGAGMPQGK